MKRITLSRRKRREEVKKAFENNTSPSWTPRERILAAVRSLERLRLRDPFYDGPWRAVYVRDIREQTELLGQQLEAALDVNQRAIAELADYVFLHRLTYQIAKVAHAEDEIDILPMFVNHTGRFYSLMGDDVLATVSFGNDGTIMLIAQNLRAGIPPEELVLDDTGLTPDASVRIAEIYGKLPTMQVTT